MEQLQYFEETTSQPFLVTIDQILDVKKFGTVRSISFKNQGTADATLNGVQDFPSGSPQIVFSGDMAVNKQDQFNIRFTTAGTKNIIVWITVVNDVYFKRIRIKP